MGKRWGVRVGRGSASTFFLQAIRGTLAPKTKKTPVRGCPTLILTPPPPIRRQKMPTLVPDLGIHHSVPPRLLTGIWAVMTRRQAAPRAGLEGARPGWAPGAA